MESEKIQANPDEPIRQHKLFRGIMLSFLFSIIVIGSVAAFGQNMGGIPEDRSQKVTEVKQALDIDEDVILPNDGIQYGFKLFRESLVEFITFDKSDKEELNVKYIDERAKEIAILDARGEQIPDSVIKSYSDRIDRAERFITLQTDDDENIDTRTVVRTALEVHKERFIDRIRALEDKPSDTQLSRAVSDFGDRITSIVDRIDQDEVSIVKNTIPIVKQKQANIRLAEMAGDTEQIRKEMRELEQIDEKLNRLHLAKLCTTPIKTLTLLTFADIQRDCPVAILMEDEIIRELNKPLPINVERNEN